MLIAIENLEPKLSEWLFIEYSNSAKIARKDLLITNVKRSSEARRLSKIARVEGKRAGELFGQQEIILLDPLARRTLSPLDLRGKRAILIGGILGDNPPSGRTKELLTKKLPRAAARNIGKQQFAIDGAVFVAKQVSAGKSVKEVPIQVGLEIQLAKGYSNFLPYAFPLVNGKPLMSGKLIEYLKKH
jgi:ribosome biogenesis SPOUT family RNA methylase Rps3